MHACIYELSSPEALHTPRLDNIENCRTGRIVPYSSYVILLELGSSTYSSDYGPRARLSLIVLIEQKSNINFIPNLVLIIQTQAPKLPLPFRHSSVLVWTVWVLLESGGFWTTLE